MEGADERRDGVFDDMRVRLIVRAGRERKIDGVADARLFTHLGCVSCAREDSVPRLVDGDGQHTVAGVKGVLHAVAMVGVDVNVGDALRAKRKQAQDGNNGVIEDAEPGGEIRGRRGGSRRPR